ncbi:DNA cytosine methyltransferase Zmet 3 isoform X1 [Zea mays]|uniref:DNA cytosine methyltransferase Zmet 3 isoform X1 n=1 Tax=Zea mays TaxID=4577 RepID=UPI0004DE9FAD|nr:DNA cytosine methyltransferase Zmet 3 isoform X1 [Zea mays]|eukprot:XP_008677397.1 DNA cytosine methyltransferase Zmet 3 isoform X1 [Zea mays]
MAHWVSDSDGSDNFEWDSDGNGEEPANFNAAGAGSSALRSTNTDAPGPSTRVANGNGKAGPSASLVQKYMDMGFTEEIVRKAMKDNGDNGADSLVELLLTYQELGNDLKVDNGFASGCAPQTVDDSDDDDILENWDDEDADGGRSTRVANSIDDSEDEVIAMLVYVACQHRISQCSPVLSTQDFLNEMSQKDKKVDSLVKMGFPEDEAALAITRCGQDASISVLVDSIYASQTAGDGYCGNLSDYEGNSNGGRNKGRFMDGNKKKRKRYGGQAQGNRGPLDGSCEEPMPLPNPMVGFNLPDHWTRPVDRSLPTQAIGPPYFYYENVALAPKGVWTTISRFLYDIQPEFVDSKYFCAAARKRGYIHNLPLERRSPLLPLPPKTIFEAFPRTKRWWPSWDPRRQFNCLQTCTSSAKLLERIRVTLANSSDPPPPLVQKFVLEECRKWNLAWVGLNKVAPLEPDEMEFLLGFPKDHTRGISRTERYRSLGNSFQVDTVAYHLSVLKDRYPQGMNVLSLFTGIGGAEVALHRLGIRMNTVVSVEKSEVNRTILKSWWDQTQTGTLIEINDVQTLTADRIEAYIRRIGGFDLVIGGSPCNNLAGSNRHHRDGLEGEHSSLFYHYFRILDSVKSIMERL